MKTRIFTDGACSGNPGPGGWGVLILFDDCNIKFSGYAKDTTNNRMELFAVIQAIKLANKLKCKEISINSDSAYVINAITKGWIDKWMANNWKTSNDKDVKNKDLWVKLVRYLNNANNITFIKVKGHSDNVWNNEVDKIAKEAMSLAK